MGRVCRAQGLAVFQQDQIGVPAGTIAGRAVGDGGDEQWLISGVTEAIAMTSSNGGGIKVVRETAQRAASPIFAFCRAAMA